MLLPLCRLSLQHWLGIVNLYLSLVYVSLLGPNINMKLLERTEATNKETLGKGQKFLRWGVLFSARLEKTLAARARSGPGSPHPWYLLWEEAWQAAISSTSSVGAARTPGVEKPASWVRQGWVWRQPGVLSPQAGRGIDKQCLAHLALHLQHLPPLPCPVLQGQSTSAHFMWKVTGHRGHRVSSLCKVPQWQGHPWKVSFETSCEYLRNTANSFPFA